MGTVGMVIYIVVIIGVFWLIAIRPQKKQEKEHQALIGGLAVGDSILTTSGFYGVVIDMPDDNVVIVEFGNNKNCRNRRSTESRRVEKKKRRLHS